MAVHKLRGSRGETLVETLVAILVAALSVALLFSGVMASVEINKTARKTDDTYYETVSGAEKQETPITLTPPPKVQVTVSGEVMPVPPVNINITLYGGKGIYSYKEVP